MDTELAAERSRQAGALASAAVSALPGDFPFSRQEAIQVARLAGELNCDPDTARRLLVYFLLYVGAYRREIAVAEVPRILRQFPVKWGYRKKRHDFLRVLQDMGFVFVRADYWAKVRPKKYGLADNGRRLLGRVLEHLFHVAAHP